MIPSPAAIVRNSPDRLFPGILTRLRVFHPLADQPWAQSILTGDKQAF
jgi:hypothetical protein